MNNEEMELILRRAGERLPGPAKAAPACPLMSARFRASRLAIAAAVVLLLTATVCAAALEVPIPDASGYGQWTGFPCSPGKYGLELANRYGDYTLTEQYEMWVVPHGATWLEALSDATYRAGNFEYRNYRAGERPEGWGELGVTAGRTDHPYWRAYFSMDENDVPTNLQDMTAHTYREYTLYVGEYRSEYSSWLHIKWVDNARGYIYSLKFHGAMNDREAAMEFAKQLIDANR